MIKLRIKQLKYTLISIIDVISIKRPTGINDTYQYS